MAVAGDRNCAHIDSWDKAQAYNSGDRVKQLGVVYSARWWTQGDAPVSHHKEGKAWKKEGSCQLLTKPQQDNDIELESNVRQSIIVKGQSIELSVKVPLKVRQLKSVDFYYNGQHIGSRNNRPFTLEFTPTQTGKAHFKARVTYLDNRSQTTQILKYQVRNQAGLLPKPDFDDDNDNDYNQSCKASRYRAGAQYDKGDRVKHKGKVFRCKVPGWCSQEAEWAYTPGTGDHWQQAWTQLKHCGDASPDKGPCKAKKFVLGRDYQKGDQVRYKGRTYECLVGGWCSQEAEWAYTPGKGDHWQQAWKEIATCR